MTNKKWIQEAVERNFQDSGLIYPSETGMEFLMVWSLFESRCFGGDLNREKISTISDDYFDNSKALNQIFTHFHQRYQDKDKLNTLLNDDSSTWAEDLLRHAENNISNVDKTKFILYVIQRYKEYIYHDNKSTSKWADYNQEITHCITAMKDIFDRQKSIATYATFKPKSTISSIHLMSYIALQEEDMIRK